MPNTLTYFPVTGDWENLEINLPTGGDADIHAEVQLISASVDFTPRLPIGHTFQVDDLIVQRPVNEVQLVSFDGVPTAGSFKLGYPDTSHLSSSIAYTANAGTVQSALQAVSTVGAGNVSVSGTAPWAVEFTGALGAQNVSTLVYDDALLVGATIQISIQTSGKAQRSADTSVHLDPFLARITNGQLVTPAEQDVPGVYLLSNDPLLNYLDETVDPAVPAKLIYDVHFHNIVWGPTGTGQLRDFAFLAPTDSTAIDLTSPDLTRLPYAPLPS